MKYIELITSHITPWFPFSLSLILGILFLYVLNKFFQLRTQQKVDGSKIYYQLSLFFVFNLLLIVLIINTPLSETIKGQLFSLLGITFTAAIALSSTTFLGNIMAGLMIKVLDKFSPGDFLKVGDNFGRVTEMGLLHTEIQTQDRDLTTLPNLYLVSNPVKLVRSSGTIISEDISLGYDIHHNKIEKSLVKAAQSTGLEEPFMHVQSLGDYSVVYRISGFLRDVKTIISTKAKFRENILDSLHADKIEIVSPNFMNQRVYPLEKNFIPSYQRDLVPELDEKPEDLIFDKAEEAQSIENLKAKLEKIVKEISDISGNSEISKEEKEKQLDFLKRRKTKFEEYIKAKVAQDKEKE